MDISGLSKAAVLAALYNRAQPQGMGFLHYDPAPWTEADAQAYIDSQPDSLSFDYVKGRVIKCNLSGTDVSTRLYNRDNGDNAAETVIEALRSTGQTVTPEATEMHKAAAQEQAASMASAPTEHTSYKKDGVYYFGLGATPESVEAARQVLKAQ